jgi:hypothetical protein
MGSRRGAEIAENAEKYGVDNRLKNCHTAVKPRYDSFLSIFAHKRRAPLSGAVGPFFSPRPPRSPRLCEKQLHAMTNRG